MSSFITNITELSQKIFTADPFEFDDYFTMTPDYQTYCLDSKLVTRVTIGFFGKEIALIYDLAIHLFRGAYKLTTGGLKGVYTIATVAFGLELDYQTPIKQGIVHLGFVCLYAMDFFASTANFFNSYPQHLVHKTRNAFADFLKTPNKNDLPPPNYEMEEKLKLAKEELEKRNKEEELKLAKKELEKKNMEKELKLAKEELAKRHSDVSDLEEKLEKRDSDFSDLEEEIGKTTEEFHNPSECEKIVNEILNPDTKSHLTKVKNMIKKTKVESESTQEKKDLNWFESANGINKKITSFTHKNTDSTYPTAQSRLFMDDDELEQAFLLEEPKNKKTPSSSRIPITSIKKPPLQNPLFTPKKRKYVPKSLSIPPESCLFIRKDYDDNWRKRVSSKKEVIVK